MKTNRIYAVGENVTLGSFAEFTQMRLLQAQKRFARSFKLCLKSAEKATSI